MPRPNALRAADTLDPHQASTQDHSNASNNSRGGPGYAPSQSQAIRNVTQEQAQEQHGSNPQHRRGREEDDIDRDLADSETLTGDEGGFDDDDMMDKMSSSPSIADEDIDFEMVYALHTFTATVEGQANATKGEHMVLLDDSNSYWWLVRIVRDSTIGYLPAEHIETPTERLARLNKHRNIDLAANMLSDSAHEKSKNPIKKAIRRRNAKTVTFSAPTYVEASDYDYSTEEEEGDEYYNEDDEEVREGYEEGDEMESESTPNGGKSNSASQDERNRATVQVIQPTNESAGEDAKLRKNPTPASLRHPDSAVFNDDKTETKKLTLTPNLLRDDGNSGPSTNGHGKPLGRGLEKDKQPSRAETVISPPPAGKDRRGKKPGGVLGALFKKRAKKGRKEEEEDLEEWLHGGEKRSSESNRESEDSISSEKRNKEREEAQQREQQQRMQQQQRERELQQKRPEQAPPPPPPQQQQQQSSTIRKVEPEREIRDEKPAQIKATQPAESQDQQRAVNKSVPVHAPEPKSLSDVQPVREEERKPNEEKPAVNEKSPTEFKPVQTRYTSMDRPSPTGNGNQTYQAYQPFKPSQQQQQPQPQPQQQLQPQPQQQAVAQKPQPQQVPAKQAPQQLAPQQAPHIERLSESPEQITFHDASDRPELSVDTSSGDDTNVSAPSPIDSSPEIIDHAAVLDSEQQMVVKPWSDYNLRTYFEDDNDVRDMLMVVQHDKAAGGIKKDHPEILPLFQDATHRLAEITKKLDGMLGDWLSRRTRTSQPKSQPQAEPIDH